MFGRKKHQIEPEAINVEEAAYLIEIREIYDGWSVAVMPDGRRLNRWPLNSRRGEAVEQYLADNPALPEVQTLEEWSEEYRADHSAETV